MDAQKYIQFWIHILSGGHKHEISLIYVPKKEQS